MKKRPELSSEQRVLTGHQVKKVRKEGNIPATVYGNKYKSLSLSINATAFLEIYESAGETNVIDLKINNISVPVLIHTVQKHPVNQSVLHVEFFKVNLTEKIKTHVPVVTEGISPAVEQHLGNLLTVIDEIELEALPDELPESVVVDISSLALVNDEITVKNITVPKGVTVLNEPTDVLVKIGALVVEKEPDQATSSPEETEEKETGDGASEIKEETNPQE